MKKRGFTLVEMLASIAIMIVLGALTVQAFMGYRKTQAVDKSVNLTLSVLERARAKTLSAEKNVSYNVRINEDKVILFSGAFSSSSPTNEIYSFDSLVKIGTINLTTATNTISYKKLTGQTTATGTLQFQLRKDASQQKSVTIYSSGLIETN